MQTTPSTPAPSVTLKIDGKDVSATAGQTVLAVARENNIDIPTLCQLDGLSIHGGCRLCMVEMAGSPKLFASCALQVADNMDIVTSSPRLQRYRKTILEMLFSERNHICSVCVSNGHCELQALAQKLGVTHINLPYLYPQLCVDSSHDKFRMDHNRCILCMRCVRVCSEVEGAHTIDVSHRGVHAKIIHDLDEPWGDAQSCTTCSKCVHVCPVGAKTEKGTAVAEMAKRRHFLPYLTKMREHNL